MGQVLNRVFCRVGPLRRWHPAKTWRDSGSECSGVGVRLIPDCLASHFCFGPLSFRAQAHPSWNTLPALPHFPGLHPRNGCNLTTVPLTTNTWTLVWLFSFTQIPFALGLFFSIQQAKEASFCNWTGACGAPGHKKPLCPSFLASRKCASLSLHRLP